MDIQNSNDSIQRRIVKTGDIWRWTEVHLLSRIPKNWSSKTRNWIFKLLRRIPMFLIDLLETVRILKPVPFFGNFTRIYSVTQKPLPQHPGYYDYWYDPDRNSLVGLHLGLDLILKNGKYHLLEMNSNPGMRVLMRKMFDSEYDPLIPTYLNFAKRKGFKEIRMIMSYRPEYLIDEIQSINAKQEIQFKMMFPIEGGINNVLPIPLEPNCLYVVINSKLTPAQKILNDKFSLSQWLPGLFEKNKSSMQAFQPIPTWDHFHFPEVEISENLPNLVVKMSDLDAKKAVAMIRAENEQQARTILGIKHDQSIPKVFGLNASQKLRNRLFNYKTIFQPFIASDLTENNCLHFHRVHVFFSPLENIYVYGLRNTSLVPVPDFLPAGVVRDVGPFIPWLTTGSVFESISEEEVNLGKQMARELGTLVYMIMNDKFEISSVKNT